MSYLALGLILLAAVVHATWNLLAKQAGGGAVFVWLYGVTSSVLYAHIALPILVNNWTHLHRLHWSFLVGSGLIHVGYFLLLQRAYQVVDLSLVYPLARGTGPMLSSAAAVILFREQPSSLAAAGAALICTGIFLLAQRSTRSQWEATLCGLITGVLISLYTLCDKYAVTTLQISPFLLEWMSSMIRMVILAPVAFGAGQSLLFEWRIHGRAATWIGLLSPLAYILVLFAMSVSPVSYVAPAREISILVASLMGVRFLGETGPSRRLGAAVLMVTGVMALAVG